MLQFLKAQELHNLTILYVSVIVREADAIDTYFTNVNTRKRLNVDVLKG